MLRKEHSQVMSQMTSARNVSAKCPHLRRKRTGEKAENKWVCCDHGNFSLPFNLYIQKQSKVFKGCLNVSM